MKKSLICAAVCSLLAASPILADTPAQTTGGAPRMSALGEVTGPELIADRYSWKLSKAGDTLLFSGDYAGAEKQFRAAEAATEWNPEADRGLAEALTGEGKLSEALQVYRVVTTLDPHRMSSTTTETRTQMGFAIALSQAGQWQEAVAVYEKELPNTTHFGDAPKLDIHFDPQVPMPAQLQALAHVAIGTEYMGVGINDHAFHEFGKAIHSDPGSGFANYYYGYGWQQLSPDDKARVINTQQAKAALQKAVKIGNADVKKAAAKALAAMEDAPKAAKKPA